MGSVVDVAMETVRGCWPELIEMEEKERADRLAGELSVFWAKPST